MMDLERALALAASLCRRFEGLYLRPYLCPAGVPTVGYGATFYENGRKVQLSDPPITRQRAEDLLMHHLRTGFLRKTIRLCPDVDTPPRLAALIDFAYNLGTGNLQASTLRRKVNAGEWPEVPPQLMRWNKAGGKVYRGLTLRRRAECVLVDADAA
jgi:lysozyme